MDSHGTKWRRNIAENFNRLSRVHERYRQTDGRATTYSVAKNAKESQTHGHKVPLFKKHTEFEQSKFAKPGNNFRSPKISRGVLLIVC